jgi:hypothetical protein
VKGVGRVEKPFAAPKKIHRSVTWIFCHIFFLVRADERRVEKL